ncbi:MAG: WG repeat-containing protein, partial [Bacteroidales bacterium]|nr:WG repeat-containing protein [Bacteroidales bacterium]
MNAKGLLFAFCISILQACCSIKDSLSPISNENGQYGYINLKGEVVISPQFDGAESFSEGLARVKVDGKCGFIDKKGTIVITPQFDYWGTASFSEG